MRSFSVEVQLPPPLKVEVAASPPLSIEVTRTDAVPAYSGDYTVTPCDGVQVVRCAGLRMSTDIVVCAVPSSYGRIAWNGSTITVF